MEIKHELASMHAALDELREEVSALRQVMMASLTDTQKRKLQEVFAERPAPPRRPAVSPNSLPPTASAASHEHYDSGGS